ncbi:GH36-type glycosyl hydrolase domain-containing protein [Candidatus Amarolinea aalborgensis]|uniref:GH36-type glycosyl hydrolase domain-containing protein n=1 Tax=Candidatus Amarolinea aalborgensis TaxID=2249329 RepID=UPI003BF9D4D8
MTNNKTLGWQFIGDDGAFVLDAPHKNSYLYFPLVNEAGMMSVATPTLHGDVKTGQNTFLTMPVSVEDLHNTRSARNFWVAVPGASPWSATGNSAPQISQTFVEDGDETVMLRAGLLWHQVTRQNRRLGLTAEVLNFVPASDDQVELMQVTLTNSGRAPLTLTPTAAIPLYGRSADNLRDHRHVTSLLHRIRTVHHGVVVRPTLTFDERGHRPNSVSYAVLGAEGDGAPPVSFFPVVEDFIGEGGNLEWPAAVVQPGMAGLPAGAAVDGYEAIGGLRFAEVTLAPGEARTYILILAVDFGELSRAAAEAEPGEELVRRYGSAAQTAHWLQVTAAHWQDMVRPLAFHSADPRFNGWLKWVAVQPFLRRLFGNSFVPYHDYGRGGRGWRDLWQDCLALLMLEPEPVHDLLFSSFAGVRVDGSNATIIGSRPGEFLADRNNIPRVWMDHGAWPYLTTRLYLDQSGDLAFLLQEQAYFKDAHINRCQARDASWTPEQGTQLRTRGGEIYHGSVLEHLLIQHLTAFFNVGASGNNILLEGADWNDGMDMARVRGESVAFSALYASNLADLAELVRALKRLGVAEVALAAELRPLLDTLGAAVDYEDPAAKQARLAAYFATCGQAVSGDKVGITLSDLAHDLETKAAWLSHHIRTQEWITDSHGCGWFNGYYDNEGRRVEGDHPHGVRMTLTGQVFALMGGIATDAQAAAIVSAADRYLYDRRVGGYRLNTDFGGMQFSLGRCFGFAFGHKENGAMFSHMAVMYANALYRRGMVQEGFKVLDEIYQQCADFGVSRIYPGIPEYISERGRGLYPWLTGSASWYLLTLLTEAFGVKGDLGDLVLEPKLVAAQFDAAGEASVRSQFAGRDLDVIYQNPQRLQYPAYRVLQVTVDGAAAPIERPGASARLSRDVIAQLTAGAVHRVTVNLGA